MIRRSINIVRACFTDYYIHLKDHNERINPSESKINLSYMHPNVITTNAPCQPKRTFTLRKEADEAFQQKLFEEYKLKILEGTIDQEPEIEADPLWGYNPKPIHYYRNLSKSQLMTVSTSHNIEFRRILNKQFLHLKTTSFTTLVPIQQITRLNIHELVDLAVYASNQNVEDLTYWFAIEKCIGNFIFKLTSGELIRLKYAVHGKLKKVTPKFTQMIDDVLKEDLPSITLDKLIDIFYCCQFSNTYKQSLQGSCLKQIHKNVKKLDFYSKVNWLLTYTLCRRPLLSRKVHYKRRFQSRIMAHSMLFHLDLLQMTMNHNQCTIILYCLAKLHTINTKHLSRQIRDHILKHSSFLSDTYRLFTAIVCLPELEGGQGFVGSELWDILEQQCISRWSEFDKIQQIRIMHSFWNNGLFNEALLELYKGIEFETDSTLLYYAAQIQLANSTQRQWQIISLIAELEIIPLPYYYAFKRIYNYVRKATDWNMEPLQLKLLNTQYYYDSMRMADNFYNSLIYAGIKKYQQFSGVKIPILNSVPIENIEVAMFAFPKVQVSVDIVGAKQCIEGTRKLKQTYMNKIRSLENLGWKHLVCYEQDLKKINTFEIIHKINHIYEDFAQQQLQIINTQQQIRAQELKILEEKLQWGIMLGDQKQKWTNDPEEMKRQIELKERVQQHRMEQMKKLDI